MPHRFDVVLKLGEDVPESTPLLYAIPSQHLHELEFVSEDGEFLSMKVLVEKKQQIVEIYNAENVKFARLNIDNHVARVAVEFDGKTDVSVSPIPKPDELPFLLSLSEPDAAQETLVEGSHKFSLKAVVALEQTPEWKDAFDGNYTPAVKAVRSQATSLAGTPAQSSGVKSAPASIKSTTQLPAIVQVAPKTPSPVAPTIPNEPQVILLKKHSPVPAHDDVPPLMPITLPEEIELVSIDDGFVNVSLHGASSPIQSTNSPNIVPAKFEVGGSHTNIFESINLDSPSVTGPLQHEISLAPQLVSVKDGSRCCQIL